MSSRKPRTFAAALLLAAAAALAPAAQVPTTARPQRTNAAAEQSSDDQVQLNADLVLVSAVVSKGGDGSKLVRNLSASDFTVLDEGVPQEVAFFGDEGSPLDVVFLFDASQSVQFRRQFQREALGAFLRTLLRPGDSASVLWFNDQIHVEQDFTSQSGPLLAAMDRIPSGGATALYKAVTVASDRISARHGRRAIVILSDGRDTFSDTRLEGALAAAQRADTVVYGVNTSYAKWAVTPEFRRNDPLEYLASETGGEVYYTSRPDDVENALSRLSGRLRERYLLGFYPTDAAVAGRYHRLRVLVDHKDAHVEARTGYYAR